MIMSCLLIFISRYVLKVTIFYKFHLCVFQTKNKSNKYIQYKKYFNHFFYLQPQYCTFGKIRLF